MRPHRISPLASRPAFGLEVSEEVALAALPLSVEVEVASEEAVEEAPVDVAAGPILPPPVDWGGTLSLESEAALANALKVLSPLVLLILSV